MSCLIVWSVVELFSKCTMGWKFFLLFLSISWRDRRKGHSVTMPYVCTACVHYFCRRSFYRSLSQSSPTLLQCGGAFRRLLTVSAPKHSFVELFCLWSLRHCRETNWWCWWKTVLESFALYAPCTSFMYQQNLTRTTTSRNDAMSWPNSAWKERTCLLKTLLSDCYWLAMTDDVRGPHDVILRMSWNHDL